MAPRSARARWRDIAWRIILAGLAAGVFCQCVPMAAPRGAGTALAVAATPTAGMLVAPIAWQLDAPASP